MNITLKSSFAKLIRISVMHTSAFYSVYAEKNDFEKLQGIYTSYQFSIRKSSYKNL